MCPVAAQATAAVTQIRLTLAEIVRAHGDAYRRTHRLATVQRIALRAIAACRTAPLGGRRETCDHCGATRLTFNSCRNRHCPACQAQASARWIEARRAELLPIPYFHVVFTLPHALNALAQGNPRVIYTLLFRAAADTLLTFGRDPRHLGGTIGVTAILHTWSQTLTQHLHVHCLVTGGAVAREGTQWIRGRAAFLFPVKALSVSVCLHRRIRGQADGRLAHPHPPPGVRAGHRPPSHTPQKPTATPRRRLYNPHSRGDAATRFSSTRFIRTDPHLAAILRLQPCGSNLIR